MVLNTVEELLEDIRQGKMVILMDDEDRENEGDLVMAAPMVRPEDINFMATNARGLICLTLNEQRCNQLELAMMVSGDNNNSSHSTPFTLSIEAAEGVTTGISAADRARTVQAAVASNARPDDIVQPGHIFPLKAQEGGVLSRAGHTEAGCDLAKMAGFEPAAVIVEIMNEDGTMARLPELRRVADKYNLKLVSIEDLVAYRMKHDSLIEQVEDFPLETRFGTFRLRAFQQNTNNQIHMVLTLGEWSPKEQVLTRIQSINTHQDLLKNLINGHNHSLDSVFKKITNHGSGAVLFLNPPSNEPYHNS